MTIIEKIQDYCASREFDAEPDQFRIVSGPTDRGYGVSYSVEFDAIWATGSPDQIWASVETETSFWDEVYVLNEAAARIAEERNEDCDGGIVREDDLFAGMGSKLAEYFEDTMRKACKFEAAAR